MKITVKNQNLTTINELPPGHIFKPLNSERIGLKSAYTHNYNNKHYCRWIYLDDKFPIWTEREESSNFEVIDLGKLIEIKEIEVG